RPWRLLISARFSRSSRTPTGGCWRRKICNACCSQSTIGRLLDGRFGMRAMAAASLCAIFERNVEAYVYSELPANLVGEFKAHINDGGACQAAAGRFIQTALFAPPQDLAPPPPASISAAVAAEWNAAEQMAPASGTSSAGVSVAAVAAKVRARF